MVRASMLGAVLLAWLTWPGAMAAAQTRDEIGRAASHFEAGRAYYEQQRYQDAVREFSEAYRLTEHPDMLFNIASCQDRLGDRESAIAAYRDYLNRAEAPEDREAIEARIAELGAGDPSESQAQVREPEGEPDSATTEAGGTEAGGEVESGGSSTSVLPWVALGVAGAAAIGAAVTGIVAVGIYDGLDRDCPGGLCPADRQGDIDTGSALSTASTVLTIVAVAAAGAGVALLLFGGSDDPDEPATTARLELVPGPAPLGAAARLRF